MHSVINLIIKIIRLLNNKHITLCNEKKKNMKTLKTECVLLQEGKPQRNPRWNLYTVKAFFKVDGEPIEKDWIVEAASVFAADRWANLMIEGICGTLVGAKKKIEKI